MAINVLKITLIAMIGKTVYKTEPGNTLLEGIIKRKTNEQLNLARIIQFSVTIGLVYTVNKGKTGSVNNTLLGLKQPAIDTYEGGLNSKIYKYVEENYKNSKKKGRTTETETLTRIIEGNAEQNRKT